MANIDEQNFCYLGEELKELIIAEDAPLKDIDFTDHVLDPSCVAAVRRIVVRNNGTIIDGSDECEDEEEDYEDDLL